MSRGKMRAWAIGAAVAVVLLLVFLIGLEWAIGGSLVVAAVCGVLTAVALDNMWGDPSGPESPIATAEAGKPQAETKSRTVSGDATPSPMAVDEDMSAQEVSAPEAQPDDAQTGSGGTGDSMSAVVATRVLPGEVELATRKGEWRYRP